MSVGNFTGANINWVGDAVAGQFLCNRYDDLNRLTGSYTASVSVGCGSYSATGPSPYTSAWTYDMLGNMTTATGTNGLGNYTPTPTPGRVLERDRVHPDPAARGTVDQLRD